MSTQWEYIEQEFEIKGVEHQDRMNVMGKQGWEIAAAYMADIEYNEGIPVMAVIFKRPTETGDAEIAAIRHYIAEIPDDTLVFGEMEKAMLWAIGGGHTNKEIAAQMRRTLLEQGGLAP